MGIFVEQNLNQKDGAVLVGDIKMIKLIGGEMICSWALLQFLVLREKDVLYNNC